MWQADVRDGAGQGGGDGVLLNNGAARFTQFGARLGTSESLDAAVADLDGDGDLDVFVVNNSRTTGSGNEVWVNQSAPVARDDFHPANGSAPVVVAAAQGVLVNDLAGDGGPMRAQLVSAPARGSVELASNGGFGRTGHVWYNGVGLPAPSGIASLTITDRETALPFEGVSLRLPAATQVTVGVVMEDAARGVLLAAGFTGSDAAGYELTGPVETVEAALRSVRFVPARHRRPVGESEATGFTLTVSLGSQNRVADGSIVTVVAENDPPLAADDDGAGYSTVATAAFMMPSVLVNDTDLNPGDTFAITHVIPLGTIGLVTQQGGGVSFNWPVDIGTADSKSYSIGVILGGWFERDSREDDVMVTVSRPSTSDMVTGGGFLVLSASQGIVPGTPGSKLDFGFNAKFIQGGKTLQGSVNFTLRDGGRVYEIKSGAVTSLAVEGNRSVFTANGLISDITGPGKGITVEDQATIQVLLTDRGEPGRDDSLAVTVWNRNDAVWFSSHWNGHRTVEQKIGGGNLKIHSKGSGAHGWVGGSTWAPGVMARSAPRFSDGGPVSCPSCETCRGIPIPDTASPHRGWRPHRPRPSDGRRSGACARILLRRARLRVDPALRHAGGIRVAGGYHHHIGLNARESAGGSSPPSGTTASTPRMRFPNS